MKIAIFSGHPLFNAPSLIEGIDGIYRSVSKTEGPIRFLIKVPKLIKSRVVSATGTSYALILIYYRHFIFCSSLDASGDVERRPETMSRISYTFCKYIHFSNLR